MILSCLYGTMGQIYVDDTHAPKSAMAIRGDFCFLAGIPNGELAAYKPEWRTQDFIIPVLKNDWWAGVIERQYGERAERVTRYAMKKESDVFGIAEGRNGAGISSRSLRTGRRMMNWGFIRWGQGVERSTVNE